MVFRGFSLFPDVFISSLTLAVVCFLLVCREVTDDLARLLFFFMVYSILGLSAADRGDGSLVFVRLLKTFTT